jgi:hypothetical protein
MYGPPAPPKQVKPPPVMEHPYKKTVPDAERLMKKFKWQQTLKKIRLYYASQQSPFV